MKKIIILLTAFSCALSMMAADIKGIEIKKLNGETLHLSNTAIETMTFAGDNAVITATTGEQLAISRTSIGSISPINAIATEYSVTYDGNNATVINPYALQGVSTEIDGGYVTTTNTNETEELTFNLCGTTTDGGFLYNGIYKCTLKLDGVNINSNRGAAINVQCGKRIAIVLVEGTENTLSDFAGGEQKAAFYIKGHPEFEKGGTLNVTGNCKHAISAKEYIQLKKTVGIINILSSANDGIHAGQYFQMNGGTVTIRNINGDGIQAEITDDDTDEQNGQMIIKGGTIDIQLTTQDVAGLKSDSLMTISAGEITINATGAADKCIKSKTDIIVTDGTFNLTNSGNGATIDNEDETAKGLSADRDINLIGGNINIKMSGTGGKGINADGTYIQGDKETVEGPVLSITTTGARFNGTGSTTGGNTGGWNPNGGRPGGGGGGFGGSSSGSSSKAIKVMGKATLYGGETTINTSTDGAEGLESKTAIYIEGGKHYLKCYDDCINSSGCIYFNGGVTVCHANGNDAVDSNAGKAGAITIGNGTIFAYTSKGSPEEGFDCDNNSYIRITGTGIGISAGGAQGGSNSSTISNAAQGYNFVTSSISYSTGRYYTLADSNGNNLVTYSFDANVNSTLSLITATGMTKGNTYTVKYSTTKPTDATTDWHGLFLGSSAQGTSNVTSFSAK